MPPLHPAIQLIGLLIFVVGLYLLFRHEKRSAEKVHLPVVPTKRPAPRCRTCAKFDLRAGQDIIAKQPVFSDVTRVLTVAEVGYGYKLDEQGERQGLAGPKEAVTFQWSDMGACTEHMELRVASDVCDSYVPRDE